MKTMASLRLLQDKLKECVAEHTLVEVNPETVIANLAAHCWEATNPAADETLGKAR